MDVPVHDHLGVDAGASPSAYTPCRTRRARPQRHSLCEGCLRRGFPSGFPPDNSSAIVARMESAAHFPWLAVHCILQGRPVHTGPAHVAASPTAHRFSGSQQRHWWLPRRIFAFSHDGPYAQYCWLPYEQIFNHSPTSTLLGRWWPLAGGAAFERSDEDVLDVFQHLVEAQAAPCTFGEASLLIVMNKCAAVTRVRWRWKPLKERPSKWSRPSPVFSSR